MANIDRHVRLAFLSIGNRFVSSAPQKDMNFSFSNKYFRAKDAWRSINSSSAREDIILFNNLDLSD